jgi:diphosphomevalonate decarboxylase
LKVTVVAHPIQGLIKYHGLRRLKERIPYHDSISVCVQALTTTTTVETLEERRESRFIVNGKTVYGQDKDRIEVVLGKLSTLAEFHGGFRVVSENSLKTGKGLGFSASGFAALGLSASRALGLSLDAVSLSEIVRLGAGSSTRSLAGRFAIWYADKKGRSYAEQIKCPEDIDISMVIVPIHSELKTDEAHAEVLSSPLFKARCRNIGAMLEKMKKAIVKGDTVTIGRLAEEDTLNLHAITMTGKSRMLLWEPDTIRVIRELIKKRNDGVQAWYSMDTGPSVFINTYKENSRTIAKCLREIGLKNIVVSEIGESPIFVSNHLF